MTRFRKLVPVFWILFAACGSRPYGQWADITAVPSPGDTSGTGSPSPGSSSPACVGLSFGALRIERSVANPLIGQLDVTPRAAGAMSLSPDGMLATAGFHDLFILTENSAAKIGQLPAYLSRIWGIAFQEQELFVSAYIGDRNSSPADKGILVLSADRTEERRRLPFGAGALAAAGEGRLWTFTTFGDRKLRLISALDGTVLRELSYEPADEWLWGMTSYCGKLWAISVPTNDRGRGPRLVTIDTDSGAVLESVTMPETTVRGLGHDGRRLWASGDERLYLVAW